MTAVLARGFRILRAAAVASALALPLSGCDLFGPSGPGTLDATVEAADPLGGLVLELTGSGITGFEGRGTSRVYAAPVDPGSGRHRLVVVAPTGSPLRFGIRVDDLGADPPSVRVVEAVSPGDLGVSTTGIRVRLD